MRSRPQGLRKYREQKPQQRGLSRANKIIMNNDYSHVHIHSHKSLIHNQKPINTRGSHHRNHKWYSLTHHWTRESWKFSGEMMFSTQFRIHKLLYDYWELNLTRGNEPLDYYSKYVKEVEIASALITQMTLRALIRLIAELRVVGEPNSRDERTRAKRTLCIRIWLSAHDSLLFDIPSGAIGQEGRFIWGRARTRDLKDESSRFTEQRNKEEIPFAPAVPSQKYM